MGHGVNINRGNFSLRNHRNLIFNCHEITILLTKTQPIRELMLCICSSISGINLLLLMHVFQKLQFLW